MGDAEDVRLLYCDPLIFAARIVFDDLNIE